MFSHVLCDLAYPSIFTYASLPPQLDVFTTKSANQYPAPPTEVPVLKGRTMKILFFQMITTCRVLEDNSVRVIQ